MSHSTAQQEKVKWYLYFLQSWYLQNNFYARSECRFYGNEIKFFAVWSQITNKWHYLNERCSDSILLIYLKLVSGGLLCWFVFVCVLLSRRKICYSWVTLQGLSHPLKMCSTLLPYFVRRSKLSRMFYCSQAEPYYIVMPFEEFWCVRNKTEINARG